MRGAHRVENAGLSCCLALPRSLDDRSHCHLSPTYHQLSLDRGYPRHGVFGWVGVSSFVRSHITNLLSAAKANATRPYIISSQPRSYCFVRLHPCRALIRSQSARNGTEPPAKGADCAQLSKPRIMMYMPAASCTKSRVPGRWVVNDLRAICP